MNNRNQRQRRRQKARRRLLKKLSFLVLCCFLLFFLLKYAGRLIEGARSLLSEHQRKADKERLAEEECPESLLELLEKNPEARDFVLDYEKNKDKVWDRDVADEVTEGEIPLFLQWDERWGYESYGDDFLAVTGCGPTCLSMVVCGLTGETKWNPYETAQWAEEQGFYVSGSGSSWELMSTGAEKLGLSAEELAFDETHIRAALTAEMPIICVMGPGDFTTGGHFLVLTGVDENGDICLHDPNSPMRSEQHWELDRLMRQMKNLWAYSL